MQAPPNRSQEDFSPAKYVPHHVNFYATQPEYAIGCLRRNNELDAGLPRLLLCVWTSIVKGSQECWHGHRCVHADDFGLLCRARRQKHALARSTARASPGSKCKDSSIMMLRLEL